jgi:hypothetical protein
MVTSTGSSWLIYKYTIGKARDDITEKRQGGGVVRDVELSMVYGTGTCNNNVNEFFTCYELAQFLLSKQTTLLGSLRKNKPELPRELVPKKCS